MTVSTTRHLAEISSSCLPADDLGYRKDRMIRSRRPGVTAKIALTGASLRKSPDYWKILASRCILKAT